MHRSFSRMRIAVKGTIFTAALALIVSPAIAQAQDGYQGNAANPTGQQQQMNFDQATLQQFASAATQLSQIHNEFAEKLEGVQDQEKAMDMQRQANEQMVQAVENEGISVEKYNAIANQMNQDPELRQQVQQMIDQKSD